MLAINILLKLMPKRTKKSSGKYPCEICGTKTFLETHHILGRKIVRANHPSNLVNLCPNCHNELHWGKIIIEKWVMTTNGKELLWHREDEGSFTGDDSIPHIIE